MTTPANPKSHHYAKQLEGALCRGAWLESNPAKDYKGNFMDWEETFRKFKKHCTGQDGEHAFSSTEPNDTNLMARSGSVCDNCGADADVGFAFIEA